MMQSTVYTDFFWARCVYGKKLVLILGLEPHKQIASMRACVCHSAGTLEMCCCGTCKFYSSDRCRSASSSKSVAAKERRQTFDGCSSLQWWFGSQCDCEVQEQGLGGNLSCSERRLQFQTAAQTAFNRADARKTLRMRSRVLRNPTVGQLVRYFRKSKRWGRWQS